jgi:hypothetical protein
MSITLSSREAIPSKGNADKSGSKGFLFFGRKPSIGKQLTAPSENKVGIFSARSLRAEGADPNIQVVSSIHQCFDMKEKTSNSKAYNLNFLSRHSNRTSTKNLKDPLAISSSSQLKQTNLPVPIPSTVGRNETNSQKTVDTEGPTFNSPRVKGMPEFPQSEFMFKFGPKMNYGEAVDLLNKKSSNFTKTIDVTEITDIKKTKFSSFFDTNAKNKKSVSNLQFELRTSVDVPKPETKSSQKAFPWRVFSFDKKQKVKTEENKSGISSMVTQIKSNIILLDPLVDLSLKSPQTDMNIFSKKRSFSNLQIKPNYYMKSLEYYFLLERNDYFSKIYKEHFQLCFNSMKFIRLIDKSAADAFVEKNKLNLKKKVFYKGTYCLIRQEDSYP